MSTPSIEDHESTIAAKSRSYLYGKLCEPCSSVIRVVAAGYPSRKERSSNYDWKPDDYRKCWVCLRLFEHFSANNKINLNFESTFQLTVKCVEWGDMRFVHAQPLMVVKFNLLQTGDDMLEPPASPPSSHTWTIREVSIARAWLSSCMSEHDICQHDIEKGRSSKLPTRLVYITHNGTALTACLCETATLPTCNDHRYLTLSHCWGTKKFLTLTYQNYKEFTEAIPISDADFNQTFRDAFQVTFDLGYHYIWIDSLCIIQDPNSTTDWENECPHIGDYYTNSDCNISASASTGTKGLFGKRDLETYAPPKVPGNESYLLFDVYKHLAELRNAPVLRRGWVMQENALSSRSLHFTSQGVFWVCRALIESDVFPRDAGYYFATQDSTRSIQTAKVTMGQSLSVMSPVGQKTRIIQQDWMGFVVQQFSQTELTFSTDRLPALSGLATIFQRALNTRYLAGHWEDMLLETLSWECWEPSTARPTSCQPTNQYIAPSWSWASANTRVRYLAPPSQIVARFSQILYVDMIPATSDLTGAVRHCSLRLLGPLSEFRVILSRYRRYSDLAAFEANAFDSVLYDILIEDVFAQVTLYLDDQRYLPDWISKQGYKVENQRNPGRTSDSDSSEEKLYLLPLFVASKFYGNHPVKALVLKQSPIHDKYQRVGVAHIGFFQCPPPDKDPNPNPPFTAVSWSASSSLEDEKPLPGGSNTEKETSEEKARAWLAKLPGWYGRTIEGKELGFRELQSTEVVELYERQEKQEIEII